MYSNGKRKAIVAAASIDESGRVLIFKEVETYSSCAERERKLTMSVCTSENWISTKINTGDQNV